MTVDRTFTYRSLEAFAKNASVDMERLSRAVLVESVGEIGRRWLPYAIAITPVGGVLSKPTKAHAPGLMKKSWQYFRNRDGFETLKNYAPHGIIIDRGRRRGVTAKGAVRDRSHRAGKVNKAAKMLGSKQAPIGITRAVWRRINRVERYDISARAIAKAEAAFKVAA